MITWLWPDEPEPKKPEPVEVESPSFYIWAIIIAALVTLLAMNLITDRIQQQQEKYRPDIHYDPRR